ncbi:sinapoylglucose--choline O-sinapoyltransferase [Ranunculus cassubicifolius]
MNLGEVCIAIRDMFVVFLLVLLSSWSITTTGVIVKSLPGFQGPLPFHLETGYVGVDERDDVQLFYYFVQSERNPSEDPLLLWLTGGPTCSALSALAYEIGPLYFKDAEKKDDVPTLILNPNSWTKVSNIIFLDAPVGSGFSYSNTAQGSEIYDTTSAQDTFNFLIKWLIERPEFLSNELYVGGDSYSGIIVPIIIQELIRSIEDGKLPFINFKGYILGNPVTNRHLEENAYVPYAHAMGLISTELYESLERTCKGEYVNYDKSSIRCSRDYKAYEECVSGTNIQHILEPLCSDYSIKETRRPLATMRKLLNFNSILSENCRTDAYNLSKTWANNDRVQSALHIRKGTIKEWVRCFNVGFPYTNDVTSTIEYHRRISTKGYRSLIYSGDHDMEVSHISTEEWIQMLNSSIVHDWHQWLVDEHIAGYTRTFSNGMTYATVKGAGHTAPEYMPKECMAMFTRWISHNPL